MNRKLKYGLIIGTGSLATMSVGAGTAVGIILPNALKLKKGLESFVVGEPGYDTYKNLANKKVYYVALGDSLTAGFNAALKRDSYSFADFLANDLRKSGKLAGYKNLARTGATIYDLFAEILMNPGYLHLIKKADVISITIGSNDLLKIVKFLNIGIQFDVKNFINEMIGVSNVRNKDRKKLNINRGILEEKAIRDKKYPVGDTMAILTQGEKNQSLRTSIKKFLKIYKNKDFHELISFIPQLKEKMYKLIRRNLAILIRDLHNINPHAKILFVNPHFPFPQLPEKSVETEIAEIEMSVSEGFKRLVKTMRQAVEFSLDGEKNNFVDFIDVTHLPITKTISKNEKDARDGKNKTFDTYIKYQPAYEQAKKESQSSVPSYWKRNAFANGLDIHPSIFGHQLIGNAVFSRIYNHLNVKKGQSEDYYTFTTPYDVRKMGTKEEDWMRLDEAPTAYDLNAQYLAKNLYTGKGNFLYAAAKVIFSLLDISQYTNYASEIKRNIEKIKPLKYDDFTPFLEMFGDDSVIDIIISLIENKDKLIEIGKKLVSPEVKVKEIGDQIKKINNIFNVISEEDKERLNEKFDEQEKIFDSQVSDPKLRLIFKSVFQLLINQDALSALALKNEFIGTTGGLL